MKLLSQMNQKERAARIKQLIATKNTAAIKGANEKYLPEAQRRERLKNAYLGSSVAPGSDVTNRQLAHERDNATALQFGEQRSAIGQAVRQSDSTQKAIEDWYGNYKAQLQSIQESDRARQDQVAGQIKAFGEGSAAISAADGSRVNHEQVNDAALRGATADARLAAQGLQAARSRDSLNSAFGALTAVQGRADDAYASGRLANTGLSRIEAHQRESGNRAGLSEKQRLLAAQEGAYRADYVTKAKQRERQYGLDAQRQANENKYFGVKSSKEDAKFKAQYGVTPAQAAGMSTGELIALQRKLAAAKRGPAKPAGPPKVNSHGFTDAEWAAKSVGERRRIIAADKKSGGKAKVPKPRLGPGSRTPDAEQKVIGQVLKVAQVLDNGTYSVKAVDKYGQATTKSIRGAQAIIRQLKAENVDPRVIRAAYSYFKNKGKLGPDGVKQIHALGAHVGGNFDTVG